MADGGGQAHVGARDPVRDGVVHGGVREHFAAFAERMQEGDRALPRYVVAEFEALLRCGVLACGFIRARCAGCGHDRLVAFSCKRRGVCSSCGCRWRAIRHCSTPCHLDGDLHGGAAVVGVEDTREARRRDGLRGHIDRGGHAPGAVDATQGGAARAVVSVAP